ncbi:hypothetical protein [Candidatus Chloroploca asiatica]|uniref:DUF4168 domain-containing protein n=1 Tax=Candidatus Chloroploca asiatica TaxID=1506545 RepID=A0A2H3L2F6_9CHLR|nr:hypothetical protein [Candidatus Chloroploca asiatica]PDV96400.1 hypothetical protein A9Q02_06800 [Candidatus Chloroploca asiatica]
MKRIFSLFATGIGLALLAIVALSFAPAASAQGGPPTSAAQQGASSRDRSQVSNGRMGRADQSLVAQAADALGLTRAELVAQLGTDGTIAAALQSGGVDPAAFVQTMVASRTERLEAAVAAGHLTQVDADARLATIETQLTERINQPLSMGSNGNQGNRDRANQGTRQQSNDGTCDGTGTCDQSGGQQRRGGKR